MCGAGGYVPLWLAILLAPALLPVAAANAARAGAENASKAASSNSIALFSALNPSSIAQKITSISHKISLVSTSPQIFGQSHEYKLSQYFYKRAVYQLLLRKLDDAQKDLQESISHLDVHFRSRFLLGSLHFMLGRFEKAAEAYKGAVAVYDKFAAHLKEHETMEKLTETMNKVENFGLKARDTFNSLMSFAIVSRTGALKSTVQQISAQSQAHLQILEMFEAQQNQITSADVYNAMGACYLNASVDDLDQAVAAFNEAIKLSQTNEQREQFGFNLCLCLFYDRQYHAALEKLDELVVPVVKQVASTTTKAPAEANSLVDVCYKAFKLRGYLNSYFGNSSESTNDYTTAASLKSEPIETVQQSFYYRLIPQGVFEIILSFLPCTDRTKMLRVSRHISEIAKPPSLWPSMDMIIRGQVKVQQDFSRFSKATKLSVAILDDEAGNEFFKVIQALAETPSCMLDTIEVNKCNDGYAGWVFYIPVIPRIKCIKLRGFVFAHWIHAFNDSPHLMNLYIDASQCVGDAAEEAEKFLGKCKVHVINAAL